MILSSDLSIMESKQIRKLYFDGQSEGQFYCPSNLMHIRREGKGAYGLTAQMPQIAPKRE